MDKLAIYLVRHAESTWNAAGLWQGHLDPPLSDFGRSQARALATRLAGVEIDAILSSDLDRAVATAEPLAQAQRLKIERWPELREMNVGAWAGRPSAEVSNLFPGEWQAYQGQEDPKRGGGETQKELYERVWSAFERVLELASANEWRSIAITTHGGCVRSIACYVMGLTPPVGKPIPLLAPHNASISLMRRDNLGLRLETYNDTAHLQSTPRHTALDS